MLKWVVLMNDNPLNYHRSMFQRIRVLRNYMNGPSLSRPTMPGQCESERGAVINIHRSSDRGGVKTVNLDT